MSRMSILIVDDDRDFLEGMNMALEGLSVGVDMAGNGFDAIELCTKNDYDLIFMDVKLPKKNGVQTFLEIKKIRPDSRVYMMTGYSVEQLLKQALDNGALRVLYKPFDIQKVIDIIQGQRQATILIVDDDVDFAESLAEALQANRFRVVIRHNGKDACSEIAGDGIDVLILDLRMPDWNGLETTLELRRRGCSVPTLIVTAYATEEAETIAALKGLGVEEILVKPVDPARLVAMLEHVVPGRDVR